jgi:hypothetical protein
MPLRRLKSRTLSSDSPMATHFLDGLGGCRVPQHVRIRVDADLRAGGALAEAEADYARLLREGWTVRPPDVAAAHVVQPTPCSGARSARGPARQPPIRVSACGFVPLSRRRCVKASNSAHRQAGVGSRRQMPYATEIDHAAKRLFVTAADPVGLPDALDLLSRQIAAGAWSYASVHDTRAVTWVPSPDDIHVIVAYVDNNSRTPGASRSRCICGGSGGAVRHGADVLTNRGRVGSPC